MGDPQFLDSEVWAGIGEFLTWLGLFALFVIGSGLNFLLAHAVVPSLVTTGHLPKQVERVRVALYGVALVAFVGASWFFVRLVVTGEVISDIYDRFWI